MAAFVSTTSSTFTTAAAPVKNAKTELSMHKVKLNHRHATTGKRSEYAPLDDSSDDEDELKNRYANANDEEKCRNHDESADHISHVAAFKDSDSSIAATAKNDLTMKPFVFSDVKRTVRSSTAAASGDHHHHTNRQQAKLSVITGDAAPDDNLHVERSSSLKRMLPFPTENSSRAATVTTGRPASKAAARHVHSSDAVAAVFNADAEGRKRNQSMPDDDARTVRLLRKFFSSAEPIGSGEQQNRDSLSALTDDNKLSSLEESSSSTSNMPSSSRKQSRLSSDDLRERAVEVLTAVKEGTICRRSSSTALLPTALTEEEAFAQMDQDLDLFGRDLVTKSDRVSACPVCGACKAFKLMNKHISECLNKLNKSQQQLL